MKNKKTYFTKAFYSIYMGLFMGFIITSVFLVIITNVDKYFFNSYIGIRGDYLYYIGTAVLIPIFGIIFIYNKRIVVEEKELVLRENSFSFDKSIMDIFSIKSISVHKQIGRRKIKKSIKFADGETALMIPTKPFSKKTLSLLLNKLNKINPEIIYDDYYKEILNSN